MNPRLFLIVLTALFTALLIVGSQLAIPFWPVPVVLANMFALLAGMLLGPVWGGLSALVFLLLGILGLGVFANGSGGIGSFAGPTGGFLIAYLVSAVVAGLVAGKDGKNVVRLSAAGVAGLATQYLIGLPWFQLVMIGRAPDNFPHIGAAAAYMAPYLIGDALKVIVAVAITRAILPVLNTYLGRNKPALKPVAEAGAS